MDIVIGIVAGLIVGLVLGVAWGRSGGKAQLAELQGESDRRIRAVADAVARGGLPSGAEPGSAEADLQLALESGWTPREQEQQRALQDALERVSGYLERVVRAPLAEAGPKADADELRDRIERALGALQDLDFFLTEPSSTSEGRDLVVLVQQVTREFALDQAVAVRMRLSEHPVRVRVNPAAFLDALYLVLHNAGRFGGRETVDVTVDQGEGSGFVRVRDRGPGFSEEAFKRAFDPFYSTSDDGLGLGLPHARKVLERMGGRIQLRNVPDGGAEVQISFPLS